MNLTFLEDIDLSFVLPLLVGSAITLFTTWLTGREQAKRDDAKRAEERANVLADRRAAQSREQAQLALDALVRLKNDVDKESDFSRDPLKFDQAARHEIIAHARLIRNEPVRKHVMRAIGSISGVKAAAHELDEDARATQFKLLTSAEAVLAACVRDDKIPQVHLDYINKTQAIVKEVWAAAEAQGQVFTKY